MNKRQRITSPALSVALLTTCLPYLLGNNALPTAIGTAFALLLAVAGLGWYLSEQFGRTATAGAVILLLGGLVGVGVAVWFGIAMSGIRGNPNAAYVVASQGINVHEFVNTGTTSAIVFGLLSLALFVIGIVKLARG